MGLFDSFKKKVEKKSEEINPLYNTLNSAGFGISNMQVNNELGTVNVQGEVEDGETLDRISEFLNAQQGVSSVVNNITITDVSDQNIKYVVATKGSNLNVRAGGSTSDEIVGRFKNGSEVILVKRLNATWYLMRGTGLNEELVEGYCHTDYIKAV